MKKKIIICFIVIVSIGLLSYLFLSFYHFKIKADDIKKIKATNLMIVAHPDDEIIWGGSHLIDDDYLVVCVTCGQDKTRVKEFEKMMSYTNDAYIMLDYPDKVFNKRSEWNFYDKQIIRDLKEIINAKDWDLIVTHNPQGEYGHIQHKLVSDFVTSITNKNIYYFGKYYEKDQVPKDLVEIPTINYLKKTTDMIEIYSTQKIIKPYGHMLNHESWIKYEDWKKN